MDILRVFFRVCCLSLSHSSGTDLLYAYHSPRSSGFAENSIGLKLFVAVVGAIQIGIMGCHQSSECPAADTNDPVIAIEIFTRSVAPPSSVSSRTAEITDPGKMVIANDLIRDLSSRWQSTGSSRMSPPKAAFVLVHRSNKRVEMYWATEKLYCNAKSWVVELNDNDRSKLERLGVPFVSGER